MLENAETMFDNMELMMKKLKKYSYEKNMKEFRERNNHFFFEMIEHMAQAQNQEIAAQEIAETLAGSVQKRFAVKDKIGSRKQADLNFFMIYYVFPAILLTGNEAADKIADAICSEWGKRFKDSKIRYADYDTIYGAFREKIFGIF